MSKKKVFLRKGIFFILPVLFAVLSACSGRADAARTFPERSATTVSSSKTTTEASTYAEPPTVITEEEATEESTTKEELSLGEARAVHPKTVYWGATGTKYHIDPHCMSLTGKNKKKAKNSGSLKTAKAAGRSGWCGICSAGWSDEELLERGNPYADN
jgi:hypothetical protein